MDGKVLILCDELPGDYGEYCVKDRNYLISPIRLPEDDLERIFVCWDSIIPEDRRFIEMCKYYARFSEKPEPNFALSQTGATDVRSGTLKSSIQEQAYFDMYERNLKYLSMVKQRGEDVFGEAMELAVQFPFDANQRFFEDFSRMLNLNNIVTILPSYSINSERNICNYRAQMLEAWQNANKFMTHGIKSGAKVVSPMVYTPMDVLAEEEMPEEFLDDDIDISEGINLNRKDENTNRSKPIDLDEKNDMKSSGNGSINSSNEDIGWGTQTSKGRLNPTVRPCLMDVYNKAGDELLKIYSMPIFGEEDDDKKGEEGPTF